MDKARIELGPDAMLVESSQTGQELKELGQLEVVFALPREHPAQAPAASPSKQAALDSGTELVLRELAELRRNFESFRHATSLSATSHSAERLSPEMAYLSNRLLSAGFSREMAFEIAEHVAPRIQTRAEGGKLRMGRDTRDLFTHDLGDALLEEEITSRFAVAPTLGDGDQSSTAVMLVGPSGAGKTTSLVKLAFEYGLKARRPVHLLSLDTLRIGGWEHLSAYATIGGLNFRPLPDCRSLAATLAELAGRGLVLIDTPGFGRAEDLEADELASIARELPVEVQLVLPAHASSTFAAQSSRRFARFCPAKLLLTHTDAIEEKAGIVESAMRSGLPLSFLGTGQQVPEDLRAASRQELSEGLLPRARAASMAA